MFCKWCGQELPDDAKFCKNCGTPTQNEKTNEYETVHTADEAKRIDIEEDVSEQHAASKPKRKHRLVTFLLVVMMISTIAIALLNYLGILHNDHWHVWKE